MRDPAERLRDILEAISAICNSADLKRIEERLKEETRLNEAILENLARIQIPAGK